MLVKTYSAAVNGLEVTTVTVEISLMRGVMFHLSGLADAAVKESHDRIVAALSGREVDGGDVRLADLLRDLPVALLAPAD